MQGHIFAFWETLSAGEQAELLESTSKIDFGRVNEHFSRAMAAAADVALVDNSLQVCGHRNAMMHAFLRECMLRTRVVC